MTLPFEIYLAILIACSCLVLLTVSSLATALYFRARIIAMENIITRLEGDLAGLIHESEGFVSTMQQVAMRGSGVMEHIDRISRTARMWSDRTNRMAHTFMVAAGPTMQLVARHFRDGGDALNGVHRDSTTPDKKHTLTRSIEMSESKTRSAAPRIVMAFGVGALIGAGVALLVAPRSGKQTREMVGHKTNDLKDTAVDVIDRGKHIVDEVKHEAQEAYNKGKKAGTEAAAA